MEIHNNEINQPNPRRGVVEETAKEDDKQKTKETDAEKARLDRCRRRAERKGPCRCGQRSDRADRSRTRRRRVRRRKIISQNPFIIFFLEMYFKTPEKRVTEVARQAGKEWCILPEAERIKYIRLAERERKRRRRGRGRVRRTRRRRRRRTDDDDDE